MNVAMTTANVSISVRIYLAIIRAIVYLDMTSTMTANLVSVTCTFICHQVKRNK